MAHSTIFLICFTIHLFCSCKFTTAFGFFNVLSFSDSDSASAGGSSVQVFDDLLGKKTSDIMLTFDNPMSNIISSYYTKIFSSQEEHVTEMVNEMLMAAKQRQAPAVAVLNQFGVEIIPLWLTNQIFVKQANPVILAALMGVPWLKSITEEVKFPLLPMLDKILGSARQNVTEWNIKKVMAEELWKEGVKGKGVVVASIDTGVRGTHAALRKNYVGNENNGWYDPIFSSINPTDPMGHGTHTVGTMVGSNGVGIAPKAKWMACRGCTMISCVEHALIACGQFFLCPSAGGKDKNNKVNCTNIPDIINNSWGGSGGTTFYEDVINAWKAAGIRVFFANGNSGPKCETSASPGDNEYAITVGSTGKDDKLSPFSSRGPKSPPTGNNKGFLGTMRAFFGSKRESTNVIRPEICAPGHDINSAGILSDTSYKISSGTSMAVPLVAGAAALLLSANPKLSQEDMKYLLYSTAEQKLPPSATEKCGLVPEKEFPNNMYGHGRLNVFEAYKKMKSMLKEEKDSMPSEEKYYSESGEKERIV